MTVVRMSDEVNLTRQPWTSVSPALEDAEARQYRAPGLSRPGLAYRLSVQAPEDLISRALAGSQRTVHGRLMPVELGRFTSEEQRVIDRAGESRLRLDTADAYVAVGAAGKGIGCPVVRGAGDNLAIDLRTADAQRPPQRIQCAIQALPGGQACKRIGERAARPADQNRRVHRVAGPPPVEWLVGRPDVSGVFNLGSGHARSFKDLAEAANIQVELIATREEADRLVRSGRRAAVLILGPKFSKRLQRCSFLAAGWREPQETGRTKSWTRLTVANDITTKRDTPGPAGPPWGWESCPFSPGSAGPNGSQKSD